MDFLQDILNKNKKFLEKHEDSLSDVKKDCNNFFKELDNFLETGDVSFFKEPASAKENAESGPSKKRRGRQNKPALADITEINASASSIDIKKEKVSDVQDVTKKSDADIRDIETNIKKEIEEMPAPTKLPPRKKKTRSGRTDVAKRSTRSTTRTRNENAGNSNERNYNKISSDVIIQNTTVPTIEIPDSEKDSETDLEFEKNAYQTESKTRNTRSKRTKQKQDSSKIGVNNEKMDQPESENIRSTHNITKQNKRVRSESRDKPITQIERKKPRSSSNTDQEFNGSVQTEYEDAASTIEDTENRKENINVTYVASKNLQENNEQTEQPSSINSTIVVTEPKIVINDTDYQKLQENVPENACVRTDGDTPELKKKTKGVKQIFSPYDSAPLKKKVEAFEKLGAEASNIPARPTGAKKKFLKKDTESRSKEDKVEEEERQRWVEKPRACTPLMSRFQPQGCSTARVDKLHLSCRSDITGNNESVLSAKSASALKASQAEFRERERRRREKEKEALRKKEALLQAQTEEKRRKREEKQQKAQQQREILEKEKQRYLETQRVKEEKYKQAVAKKEEKLQKQKEEAEKKRMMVKKKADELKENEEAIKMPELGNITKMIATLDKQSEMTKTVLKQKVEGHPQHQVPIYMTTKPPLLPTNDCYDSDDPEYGKVKRTEPDWSRDVELTNQQMAMNVAGEQIKNSFFCRQAHTPDLQEIFEHIDPRKLKRTSSAIWRKPPRYTLMPTIEDKPLFSEDEESD